MSESLPKVQHAQTLVEMNHCVGTARRDAAFDSLVEYCRTTKFNSANAKLRKCAYSYCLYLVNETLDATARSALIQDKQGILDRPTTHFLKMLQGMVNAMEALANHVLMVERDEKVLLEAFGEENHKMLVKTSVNFVDTETAAAESFFNMLDVGRKLLKTSTDTHRVRFSKDDERRYALCYEEYRKHYMEILQNRRREDARMEEIGG